MVNLPYILSEQDERIISTMRKSEYCKNCLTFALYRKISTEVKISKVCNFCDNVLSVKYTDKKLKVTF